MKNQKTISRARRHKTPNVLTILSTYTLLISLWGFISGLPFIWPFVLFWIVISFNLYYIYIAYIKQAGQYLNGVIIVNALLASLIMLRGMFASIADVIGWQCHEMLGEASSCADSTAFAWQLTLWVMILMVILSCVGFYTSICGKTRLSE